MFESQYQIMNNMTWQAFERNLCRLLTYEGYDNVRLVGQTGDHGADVTGNKAGKKWLFQAKHWKKPVGLDVAQETINAVYEYKADIPVIVSSNGFDAAVKSYQSTLLARKIPLQLWDSNTLVSRTKRLPDKTYNTKEPRDYQSPAIDEIVNAYFAGDGNRALVVMATGLGKTFVAAESVRRIRANNPCKVLPSYDNGYKRLTAVTSQAALVPITRSQIALLPGWIGAAEKVGMCHMLANRKEIQWVDEDDGTV